MKFKILIYLFMGINLIRCSNNDPLKNNNNDPLKNNKKDSNKNNNFKQNIEDNYLVLYLVKCNCTDSEFNPKNRLIKIFRDSIQLFDKVYHGTKFSDKGEESWSRCWRIGNDYVYFSLKNINFSDTIELINYSLGHQEGYLSIVKTNNDRYFVESNIFDGCIIEMRKQ